MLVNNQYLWTKIVSEKCFRNEFNVLSSAKIIMLIKKNGIQTKIIFFSL